MSQSQSLGTALPCAACKQPVIEKRSADGALVVLDAATKRLHLCVKRKAEATKAKPPAAPRPPAPPRPAPPPRPAKPARPARPPRPPKRVELAKSPAESRVHAKVARPPRPPRKDPPRRPRKTTLRTPQQVEEILKGRILRWRTAADSPTSFCAECSAPVLVGFSHVRWDVMMLDAAGHRPHDCETSRQANAALHRERPVDIPALPVETARRVVRPAPPPIAPIARPVEVAPRPRRRPASHAPRVEAANSCETCGKLKSLVNGEWVCLHC